MTARAPLSSRYSSGEKRTTFDAYLEESAMPSGRRLKERVIAMQSLSIWVYSGSETTWRLAGSSRAASSTTSHVILVSNGKRRLSRVAFRNGRKLSPKPPASLGNFSIAAFPGAVSGVPSGLIEVTR